MTAAPSRARRPPAPEARPVRLLLEIDRTRYGLRAVACDPALGRRAFRLLKDDGTTYDVIQSRHGPECDCPDFIFRRDGLDPRGCKHVRALIDAGMIAEGPAPRVPLPGRTP